MNDINSPHAFSSKGREGMSIDGVSDVISFDELGAVMDTSCGKLAVEGEGLHVTVLNVTEGKVIIEGRINGVYYFDDTQKRKSGIFGSKK